jgi:hypothetical protein
MDIPEPVAIRRYPYCAELERRVDDSAPAVFARLDDHRRLARHMERPDWRMLGSHLDLDVDPGTKPIGQHMRWTGRIAGLAVSADEVVVERVPPERKVWETVGAVRLLVIGAYRMGFVIEPDDRGSRVVIRLDYSLPERAPWRWLGRLFGKSYAHWCLERMMQEAAPDAASPRG